MKQLLATLCLLVALPTAAPGPERIKTKAGPIEGSAEADGIRSCKAMPCAAPPVGPLRWQAPQPVKPWTHVRQAAAFAGQCMQRRQFADMVFRSSGTSEDCLYLNVWAPAKRAGKRLPVLVYFYGGGFTAGEASGPPYDRAATAPRGIAPPPVNYPLRVFRYFPPPQLAQ